MCFSSLVIILIDVKIGPSSGNGRLFILVPESVSFLLVFAFFLAIWYVYIFKATLDLFWPGPRISHFFKKGNSFGNYNLDVRAIIISSPF